MLNFFKHKKFWLPLLVVALLFVVLECLLRTGAYDAYVEPNSYLGNAMQRQQAIDNFGKENIDWITVGNSKIDWGIDHHALAKARKKMGLKHIRLSIESSNFLAIQAVMDWSINNMPNLQGIMVGITETNLAQYSYLTKLYKIIWPFRSALDYQNYQVLAPRQGWLRYFYQLAVVNFAIDLKHYITDPIGRNRRIEHANKSNVIKVLKFKRHRANDICALPLNDLAACVAAAEIVQKTPGGVEGFELPKRLCSKKSTHYRLNKSLPVAPTSEADRLTENWVKLFEHIISKDKAITLVLLPEHEMHDYMIKPSNAHEITEAILQQLKGNPSFKLIDLRGLFEEVADCEVFADPLHFNNQGIELITQALIDAFWQL